MKLTVNGKPSEVKEPMTVAAFLVDCKLAHIRVAIELNGSVVPRSDFEKVMLKDGDSMEVVTLVGGG